MKAARRKKRWEMDELSKGILSCWLQLTSKPNLVIHAAIQPLHVFLLSYMIIWGSCDCNRTIHLFVSRSSFIVRTLHIRTGTVQQKRQA
mmetsp:Transcript_1091/g.2531  ORF Transcript_1091/g.2531 Transcript_1091/m.2531 type:complete len:89 (-) Transcript_1091:106-372(-)